jgi:photosystem II stability/assembly factor-like uncharacterized protein
MRLAAISISLGLMLVVASCGSSPARTTNDSGVTIELDGSADAGAADSSPWSLVSPLGPSTPLDLVTFHDMGAAGSDLYVVGSTATILRSTDRGGSWSSVGLTPGGPNGLHPIFLSFSATAEDDVWIGGIATPTVGQPLEALLLHGTDRGQTWQAVRVPGLRSVYSVWAIDGQRVLVASDVGEIWRTDDAGASWARVFADSELILNDFWGAGTGATDLYAVGAAYVRAATPDGGQSPGGGDDGGATGDAGISFDAGRFDGGALDGTGTTRFTGVILRSMDAGATWSVVLRDAPCQLWQITGTPDGAAVHATGNCGTIAGTLDRGATWRTTGAAWRGTSTNAMFPIRGVWVAPAGHTQFALDREVCESVWVVENVSSQGYCESLPWRDHGNGARSIASPTGMWGDGDDVWVYGAAGFLWRRPWP